MELRVLNYFLMVAREGNITRAAMRLHVTQPTLSRQLIQLEDELGVKLFHRNAHNILLTEEGILLKRRAQEMLELAEKARQEVTHEKEELTGVISIGGGELQSMNCLSKLMTEFQRIHPHVQYKICTGAADDIRDKVDRGLIDIALFLEPVDMAKYSFIRMPVKEEWGILAPADCELAQKEYITPKDLKGIPLILTSRTLVQNEVTHWFGKYADKLNIAANYNLLYNAAVMVENGLGIVLTLKLEAEFKALKFVPLKPQLTLSSVLAWKKNEASSKATAAFIEYVKEAFTD